MTGKHLLSEIVAGLDGVSKGKWCQFHPSYCEEAKGAPFSDWDSSHDLSAVHNGERRRIATFKHASDAAHVDRLSEENIRAIVAYVEQLEKALEPFAAEANQFAETWPDGARERPDKFNLGDLRRARAALGGSNE
ncbi:hypothetical protein JVX98_13440 [Ensifer sp. PDNC004]|uniref:hypothetical protein n=1 Tax=Ensifer sp. PDNC004 TaxID=2811423 RepID=UPI0019646EDC|nr:hypothetical protein [Ensifer sp. PDNC004]QRY69219.1 hypothetical protein JVX98_13440 [Ensifer sp. PDNC004]